MDLWHVLMDIMVLLAAAMVLGGICERFRLSPLLGYLAAGTLLGPNALGVIYAGAEVELLAELGVALLLFTIGLEFSWGRLRKLGRTALLGGVLQIVVTLGVGFGAAMLFGLSLRSAVAIGAVVSLSSTACVLRLLVARGEIESIHGNHALGILLVQDAAVVPLVLLVSVLGGEGSATEVATEALFKLGGAVVLIGVLFALFNYVVPAVLHYESVRRNRDLPALLAVTSGIGSAVGAHEVGLSPALGAFVAGMLLAASPFATQIRGDVASLRALLVTLFFGSIGMLGDPAWFVANLGPVIAFVAAVVVGKAVVILVVLRSLGLRSTSSLATGLCLAQVGEFSFVLAAAGRGTLIDDETFKLLVTGTIVTLFMTPFLVAVGPRLAEVVLRWLGIDRAGGARTIASAKEGPRVVIVGFGPAGRGVARAFEGRSESVVVVDMNPHIEAEARRLGFGMVIGDAAHADVLEHAGIEDAEIVVVTVPDPAGAEAIVGVVRAVAPDAHIIVRARYQRFLGALADRGAHEVVDEETIVGQRLAATLRRRLIELGPAEGRAD